MIMNNAQQYKLQRTFNKLAMTTYAGPLDLFISSLFPRLLPVLWPECEF